MIAAPRGVTRSGYRTRLTDDVDRAARWKRRAARFCGPARAAPRRGVGGGALAPTACAASAHPGALPPTACAASAHPAGGRRGEARSRRPRAPHRRIPLGGVGGRSARADRVRRLGASRWGALGGGALAPTACAASAHPAGGRRGEERSRRPRAPHRRIRLGGVGGRSARPDRVRRIGASRWGASGGGALPPTACAASAHPAGGRRGEERSPRPRAPPRRIPLGGVGGRSAPPDRN